jgi:hypothetical protein
MLELERFGNPTTETLCHSPINPAHTEASLPPHHERLTEYRPADTVSLLCRPILNARMVTGSCDVSSVEPKT